MLRAAALTIVLACNGAEAKTVSTGPNPCPVKADADPYVPDPSIFATDSNVWRAAALRAPVTFDVALDSGRGTRLFRRFFLDPETGAAYDFEPALDPCPGLAGAAQ